MSYAVAVATGWLLCQWFAGQSGAILKQSIFQLINLTDPAAVHSLLQNAPYRSRRLAEAID